MSLLEAAKQAQTSLEYMLNVGMFVGNDGADAVSSAGRAIAVLTSAISEAEAGDKPACYRSPTGHGIYYREAKDMTPELLALEHGGRKMWTPLFAEPPTHTAAVQAALERAAKVVDAQHPFGQIAVCAAAIRAIKPEDVLEGGR